MAWAVAADVSDRLAGYITISATGTKPTTAQTTQYIADHEAALKGALAQGGWTLAQTDADADAYLQDLVVTGVAGQILLTRVRGMGEQGTGSRPDALGTEYRERWAASIASIEAGRNVIPGGAKTTGGPPASPRRGVSSSFSDTDTIPDARVITMTGDW